MALTPRERFLIESEKYRAPDEVEYSWNQLYCKVLEVAEDGTQTQIGEFFRNYGAMYNTWEPFEQDGKCYALFSPHYTGTSVMSLPDCKVIASELDSAYGFCPTGFYVPTDMRTYIDDTDPAPLPEEWQGKFGFVCGCVWGDDTTWKIEFLDLSEISEGRITRDSRFGYIELPGSCDDLQKYIYVQKGTETYPTRLSIGCIVEQHWFGGLKWLAHSNEEEEEIDLNALGDMVQAQILKEIEFMQKRSRNSIQSLLHNDTFKDDIRTYVMNALQRFVK